MLANIQLLILATIISPIIRASDKKIDISRQCGYREIKSDKLSKEPSPSVFLLFQQQMINQAKGDFEIFKFKKECLKNEYKDILQKVYKGKIKNCLNPVSLKSVKHYGKVILLIPGTKNVINCIPNLIKKIYDSSLLGNIEEIKENLSSIIEYFQAIEVFVKYSNNYTATILFEISYNKYSERINSLYDILCKYPRDSFDQENYIKNNKLEIIEISRYLYENIPNLLDQYYELEKDFLEKIEKNILAEREKEIN
jgi:hypothetical protein